MFPPRDLSHINNIDDLRQEKIRIRQRIRQSEDQVEHLMNGLPGIAFRSAFDTALGAVFSRKRKRRGTAPAPTSYGVASSNTGMADILRGVGQDTAFYALQRLIHRLLNRS